MTAPTQATSRATGLGGHGRPVPADGRTALTLAAPSLRRPPAGTYRPDRPHDDRPHDDRLATGDVDGGQHNAVLSGLVDLTTALLAGEPLPQVLQLIAQRARQVTPAAAVYVGSAADNGVLVLDVHAGQGSAHSPRQQLSLGPPGSALADVVTRGAIRTVGPLDLPGLDDGHGDSAQGDGAHGDGGRSDASGLALPLGLDRTGRYRVLVVLGLSSRHLAGPVLAATVRALRTFAARSGAALDVAAARERLEDARGRDRVAASVQALVIERLFAAQQQLAGADGLIAQQPDQAQLRVRLALDHLENAIARIGTAIYGTHRPRVHTTGGITHPRDQDCLPEGGPVAAGARAADQWPAARPPGHADAARATAGVVRPAR